MCEAGEDRSAVDYALLTHAQRVDELAAIARQRAALDAAEARLLHAMHADPVPNLDGTAAADKQWVREDVACVLRIAPQTAAARLAEAVELVTRLPQALALLERGQLTLGHTRRLIEATRPLPDQAAASVEQRGLPGAARQSIASFAAVVRRAVLAVDPRAAEQRHAEAAAQRRVVFSPQDNAVVELWALLPAAGAAALATRLQGDADRLQDLDRQTGTTRSADQRRADALLALATTTSAAVDAGAGGLSPAVNVTVALSTLLDHDEQPGALDGYGPIPAALARALAFDPTGSWRRLLTDDHGRLVDVTSHTYRPPTPIARLVRLQQQTCTFPGCRHPAARCELDHLVPWPEGATCAANLHPLCPRHHHLKHETGWKPAKEPDGTTTWTSPSGHTYARPPDDLPGRSPLPRTATRPCFGTSIDGDTR